MNGVNLTYRNLNSMANAVARELRRRGAVVESRIALIMPRSVNFIVAALGVLKSGGTYVPIDPTYPEDRQAFIFQDSHAQLILVDTPGSTLGDTESLIVLSEMVSPDDQSADLGIPVDSASLAYVTYTSGSTGLPKGVSISHGAVVDLLTADPRLAVAPGDVVGHLAPTAFDASIFEIWSALTHGGRIAVLAGQSVSTEELGRWLREVKPDWLFLTSGLFHLLVEHDLEALRSVGVLLTGGDVLLPQHVLAAGAVVSGAVYAAYGPTETTVFASLHTVDSGESYERVPLGEALSNKTMLVLDERLDELPIGEVGEIYLAGTGLARGYHNRPALTAERFLPDSLSGIPGARLYRTGDKGSRLASGEVEFFGRSDRQVKVRGFRIELGEIEMVLCCHPLVGAAAVVVADDGGKRLVAYVTQAGGDECTTDEDELTTGGLRTWLAERLPAYMLPNNYLLMDELPLDPNGKLDRTGLPTFWQHRADLGHLGLPRYVGPRTGIEHVVSGAFLDALLIDKVGVHDNFFELGGDSLRAARVLDQLRGHGMKLSARQFFQRPVVAKLAEYLSSYSKSEEATQSVLG
jgi:amino acid adenylation domain-containing protein